jgi:hypothetical protein
MIGADVNGAIARLAGAEQRALVATEIQKPPDFAIAISRNEHWCATNPGGDVIIGLEELGLEGQEDPGAFENGRELEFEQLWIHEGGRVDLEDPVTRSVFHIFRNAMRHGGDTPVTTGFYGTP